MLAVLLYIIENRRISLMPFPSLPFPSYLYNHRNFTAKRQQQATKLTSIYIHPNPISTKFCIPPTNAAAMSTTSIAYSLLLIAAMLAAAATAQSPSPSPSMALSPVAPGPNYDGAPAPALDCFPYLLNLSDCLTFVQGGSNLTKPDDGCCPELANLVDTQPICLCQLLGDPDQVGISVDMNRALKLPTLCNVSTPPVSLCAAIGIPVSATPSDAPAPAPGVDEEAAPPSPGGDSGSPTIFVSKHHFLIGLATLSFTYIF